MSDEASIALKPLEPLAAAAVAAVIGDNCANSNDDNNNRMTSEDAHINRVTGGAGAAHGASNAGAGSLSQNHDNATNASAEPTDGEISSQGILRLSKKDRHFIWNCLLIIIIWEIRHDV